MICGAITLGKIAQNRGWQPGTFINDNFEFTKWVDGFGNNNLLNGDSIVSKIKDIESESINEPMFIRPTEDTKSFSGTIMTEKELRKWKDSIVALDDVKFSPLNKDTTIMISKVKHIYSEYRFFVVDGEIVTGSVYKVGYRIVSHINNLNEILGPDEEIISTTQKMIDKWQPARAFVIDMAKTPEGTKIIEINNINSAGFYSSDTCKIVDSIEKMVKKYYE